MGDGDPFAGPHLHPVLVPLARDLLIGHLTLEHGLFRGLHRQVRNVLQDFQLFLWTGREGDGVIEVPSVRARIRQHPLWAKHSLWLRGSSRETTQKKKSVGFTSPHSSGETDTERKTHKPKTGGRAGCLDGITDSVDLNLSKLQDVLEDREDWQAAGRT